MSHRDAFASLRYIAQIRYHKSAKDEQRRHPFVADRDPSASRVRPAPRPSSSAQPYCSGYVVIRMVTPSLQHYSQDMGGVRRQVVISVRECASFAGLTPEEICLGISPGDKHDVLQSRYLLGLWKGSWTVRNLIVADIRHWAGIGQPDRAADALIVLRQFLSDFPQARLEVAPPSSVTLRSRPRREARCRRSRNLSCRRVGLCAAQPIVSPEKISPDEELHFETREGKTRQPLAGREA